MGKTSIEYLDYTWNPLAMRCTKVSEACDNCWHLERCKRLQVNPVIPIEQRYAYSGDLSPQITGRMEDPLHLKKPRRIGVQFMGDLFHGDVALSDQLSIWLMIERNPKHTFMVLTKRPEKAREFFDVLYRQHLKDRIQTGIHPLKNLWLGVTIEHPKYGYRMDQLMDIPATVRFISFEPLLADFSEYPGMLDGCDWAIAGGESGTNARPMHPDWVRSIRDLCQAAGVPFFFKGWGDWVPSDDGDALHMGQWCRTGDGQKFFYNLHDSGPGGTYMHRLGKKAAGRLLDGREWKDLPP